MKKLLVIVTLLVSSFCVAQNSNFWDGIEAFDGPTDVNPVLASQLDFYFDKMVAPLPDSINREIERLVERTSFNTDLRDFILWHLLERYRHPAFMSQDQVFVFLYDRYFSQWDIKDLHDANRELIREKAERLRRLALFNTAPDIKVGETDLLDIESECTVLFFYDHDCDVCSQERRDLDSVCDRHPEITVIAIDMNLDTCRDASNASVESLRTHAVCPYKFHQICSQAELLAVSDAYDIEATPLIYVLDRDKRIIGKKIRAKQIPLIL